jgi:type IV pilus assembly protein PilB
MSTKGLESLGFTPKNLEKVQKMISVPNGIILVTGATGTGKTTTVYSVLQKLNTNNRNLVTVEDPIEMGIEGVNQLQVMPDIGLTFGTALRSILRQDPDIIMIGEIRDDETAQIAVRASITGHLVLSTLHTNNSLNTIERLLDMEVERYLLGSALTGIVSQRLARRLCPKCREKRVTTDYEKSIFKKVLKTDINEMYVVHKDGCPDCIRGYKGRTAIQEVLLINQNIRDAIVNNARKEDLRNLVYGKSDVTTILEDGLMKVVDGVTTFDEILRVIDLDTDFVDKDIVSIKNALIGKEEHEVKEPNINTPEEELLVSKEAEVEVLDI